MKTTLNQIKKRRKIFGILFVISMIVFSSVFFFDLFVPPQTKPGAGDGEGLLVSLITLAASLLTAITSFVGFITTTIIAFRKERREARMDKLDLRKKELEIVKLEQEVGELGGKP